MANQEQLGVKRVASSDREPKRQCFAAVLELKDGVGIIKQNLRKIVFEAEEKAIAMLANDTSFREIVSKGNKLQTKCSTTIYDTVFRMCIQRNPLNFSKRCYDMVDNYLSDFLQGPITEITKANSDDVDRFLREMIKLVSISLSLLHAVTFGFSYLDRFYTPNYDLLEVVTKAKQYTRRLLKEVFEIDALQDLNRFETIEQLEHLSIIFSSETPKKATAFVPNQSCLFDEEALTALNVLILSRTFQLIPFTRKLRDDLISVIFTFL